ncbi:L-threonylcarbamoyladenylate synthase [Paenibacillus sp. MBLB2552]|uniref:Threonylcarbamoyl-AMP synthase n=1 Tax=Paenibacillus mellifer TaxID=2937794 RepID=A0A9X1XZN3_9BACL|nr:L-threonylcarbamoyladenylate synthase [Paenibacillus mellifer]MCK8488217.1 L-threonylcarbamoyladenylate synthase [Paenibacillus mellifer]
MNGNQSIENKALRAGNLPALGEVAPKSTQWWRVEPGTGFATPGGQVADAGILEAPTAGEETAALREAAEVLASGGTVAFPTETVYGLGADARNPAAVEAIFAAKGRPSDNPLIVHIADVSQLDGLVTEVNETARRLMEAFWPGPLTLVLPVAEGAVSPRVTAGLSTVGVRMPAHDVALRLIAAAGCPVAAPSANRSGRPSPTLASHVGEDLSGRIDGIVDGGPTGVGLESTVVEAGRDGVVTVLRPGGITAEQLARVAGAGVRLDAALQPEAEAGGGAAPGPAAAPRAPGMKYTHYAPQGVLRIVRGSAARVADRIQAELAAAAARGEKTGVLAFDERLPSYRADCALSLGREAELETAAHRLYAALRRFDECGVTYILAEACPEEGLGSAVMNRLLKAAGHRVIEAGGDLE